MESAEEKPVPTTAAIWIVVSVCCGVIVLLGLWLQGAYENIRQMQVKVDALAEQSAAIIGQADNALNPYVEYYNTMKELKERLRGIPDSGDTSFANRLDDVAASVSDVEKRVGVLDGKDRSRSFTFYRGRSGEVGELQDRVDELESDVESLRRAVKQLDFDVNYNR